MAETKAGVVFLAVTSCLRATKAADVKLGSGIGRWRGVANNKNYIKQTIRRDRGGWGRQPVEGGKERVRGGESGQGRLKQTKEQENYLGRSRGGGGEDERRRGRRDGERRRSRWRGIATFSPSPGTSNTCGWIWMQTFGFLSCS